MSVPNKYHHTVKMVKLPLDQKSQHVKKIVSKEDKYLKKFLKLIFDSSYLVQLQVMKNGEDDKYIPFKFGIYDNTNDFYKECKIQRKGKNHVIMSLQRIDQDFETPDQINQLLCYNRSKHRLVKNDDIESINFLYIDFDTEGAPKKPISDKKLRAICKVRDNVSELNKKRNFPEPVKGRSGNGAYLLYALPGLPNNAETKKILSGLLEDLAKKYDTKYCKIDLQVMNPGRSFRVPYTINPKGEPAEGKDHPMTSIDSIPSKLKKMSKKTWEKLENKYSGKSRDNDFSGGVAQRVFSGKILDLKSYLKKYEIKVVKVKRRKNSDLYCLEKCVYDPNHSGGDAGIGITGNGILYYHCFHASCKGKRWPEVRNLISGDDDLSEFFIESSGSNETNRQPVRYKIVRINDILNSTQKSTPIIENVVARGEKTLIVGPSGIGKSMLTLNLALFGADPSHRKKLFDNFLVPSPFKTLFIQSENNIIHTRNRIKLMMRIYQHYAEIDDSVAFLGVGDECRVSASLSDINFQNQLIEALYVEDTDIAIFDPMISFCQVDENNNSEMRRELDKLTKICDDADVSAVVVHHVGKGVGAGSVKGGRGASAIADWADNIIMLEPKKDKDNNDYLKVICQKSRNAKPFKDFCIKSTSGCHFIRFTPENNGKNGSGIDMVLKALAGLGGKVDKQDDLVQKVMELNGKSKSTAGRYIQEADDNGLIESFDNGRSKGYKLVDADNGD